MKPRIIVFDLEILPNLLEALKVWPQLSQYPGKTLKASITSIINAGWKEYQSGETHCINAWDFPEWIEDVNNDYYVCKAIREVLESADAVVTHNGARFDWKFLQTRLMINGLKPLHKIPHIDTCQVAKRMLYLFNNKLNTAGDFLVGDRKMQHEGWDLWVKVWHKDKEAMQVMEDYCKQDVDLLEKVYERLTPLISNNPNRNLFKSEEQRLEGTNICPNCSSTNLVKKGWRHTKTQSYQRLLCKDCGTSSRTDTKGNNPRTF